MGANNSDINTCCECGEERPIEGFSPRYRNTCRPCAREKEREAKFRKTGILPRARYSWIGSEKKCNECGINKSEDDYAWRVTPKGKKIRNSICKKCLGDYQKERQKDPEVRIKNKKAAQKYYSSVGKNKEKNSRYLREYGITYKDKENMIERNGGKCPICETRNPGQWWVVDHCHRTGKVRNVICDKCNKMLGLANDDMMRLLSAANYISKHSLNQEYATMIENVSKPDEELENEGE